MSKSNLKNINDLRVKKTPYLVFTKSTYSNLLLKLKKGAMWNLNQFNTFNKSLSLCNENLQKVLVKKYTKIKDKKIRQFRYNFISFKYNPNILENLNESYEYFFFKKIKKFVLSVDARKRHRELPKQSYYTTKLKSAKDLNQLLEDIRQQKKKARR